MTGCWRHGTGPAVENLAADSPLVRAVLPSPNHGDRGGARPSVLVLHYTGMADHEAGALAWLRNPLSQVSAHYMVFENGTIIQLVPESRRAWHAGRGCWQGLRDINSVSIGIEIANPGHEHGLPPYPPVQVEAVAGLALDIVTRWAIAPDRVIAHSDMAPARKMDPGERFPWGTLHTAGVGHYVTPRPIMGGRFLARGDIGQPVEALQAMLALYGYDLAISGTFDEATEQVVKAFQRHFRPERVDGVADISTIGTLRDLVASRP